MHFRFSTLKSGLGLACLLASLSLPAFSQATSGNVVGSILDPTGASIPGADVVVTNDATGVSTTTRSTSAGDYRFDNLTVGSYTISASPAGFSKAELKNVEVKLNFTITANINVSVGKSATTVEVAESAITIDTTTAQLQSVFETKQLADLPTTSGGSGVLNLSLLNAGVASSGSVGSGSGPSVAGQRPRNNNFTVEGIDNNSGSVTGPLVSVPNDAVAEFSVLQNQYSPDFGHSSGGQFNTIVKSGTNSFHGMLYEYMQNRNFNAADNFSAISGNPLHPRFDDNRFGGNVGGPIKKNKLFFFADYEYEPVGQAGAAGLLYAPTAAGYATINAAPGVNKNNAAILQKYLGTAPAAVAPSALGTSGYPVLSSVTNAAEYNQANIVGTPIQVGQISISKPSFNNYETGVASIDYTVNDKDSLRGRFILNRNGGIDTSANLPVFFQTRPNNNYLIAVSEYHNFSPSLINELRLGYNRNSTQTPAGNFSFPGLDQFPNLVFNELNSVQLGPDPNAPQFGYQNTYQLTDNLTLTKGAHTLKFGFDGVHEISPQAFTQRARGDYEYQFLSDYLYDFSPDSIGQRSAGNPVYWGNRWLSGFYANDSWKFNQNLTVNLGVRYEYDTPPAGEGKQTLNAISNVPGLISFDAPKAQTNNIMPRVGLAYSPGTSGKTSIRAGFGINYDVLYDNLGLLTLPPQLSTTQDITPTPTSNFLANGGLPANGPAASFTPAVARSKTSGYVLPDIRRPESLQWNFGIEHEFAGNYIFESRYVGTRGISLDTQSQLNRRAVVTAANALPVFWSTPSAAQISSLTNTLPNLTAISSLVPAYANAGFTSTITTYLPNGSSTYHGWANQLTRRFSNGLQFVGAYTWSHAIDNSTADTNSTSSTPRRPQDSQNINADRSSSALDHRNRFTLSAVYDLPYFKHSSWLMKNVVGNWEFAPIYTYQTGTLFTVQGNIDANLNGDTAPDRAIVNPNGGNSSVGTGTTAITRGKDIIGYVVNNPNAEYATAPKGTLSTAGRNTGMLPPIDDIDLFAAKRFSFKEHTGVELSARFFNLLNHSQYTGGYLNDIAPNGATAAQRNVFIPTQGVFNRPDQAFSSNPRSITLGAKITF